MHAYKSTWLISKLLHGILKTQVQKNMLCGLPLYGIVEKIKATYSFEEILPLASVGTKCISVPQTLMYAKHS